MSRHLTQVGRLEKDIEKKCRRMVERLGGKMLKTVALGHPGFPDRMVILPGLLVFVEFKRLGEKPTKLQDYWLGKLKSTGTWAEWFDDAKKFREYLNRRGQPAK